MQHCFHVCNSGEPEESVCALKTTGCLKSMGNGETWQGTVSPGIPSATCSAPPFNQALADPTDGKPVPEANPSYCGIYRIRPWEQSQPDGQHVTLRLTLCRCTRDALCARQGWRVACPVQSAAKYRFCFVSAAKRHAAEPELSALPGLTDFV